MTEPSSKTVKTACVLEQMIDSYHYETTISGGGRSETGLGRTSEESQQRASSKWNK